MTLRDLLVRRGLRFHNHAFKSDEIFICCPFCTERGETPDTRYRLGVNVRNGEGHCFNCGYASRYAAQAVVRRLHENPDALELERGSQTVSPDVRKFERLPKDFQLLTEADTDLDKRARRYVLDRGVTLRQLEEKQIGVSFVGRYAYRVIFPVLYKSKVRGFQARDFTGSQEPKYLTSQGEKGVYNLAGKPETVVLSEGVFKALRIEQVISDGVSGSLLGSSLTPYQLEQLKKARVKNVILWPDPDRAGRKGCIAISEQLEQERFNVGVVWPITQPADEAPLEHLRNSWNHCVQVFSWGLRQRLMLAA